LDLQHIIQEYGLLTMILLAIVSFVAGFIDAVVGGGGLILTPFMLINFPRLELPVIFGTNKISGFCGTALAVGNYARRVKYNFKLLSIFSVLALLAAFGGAQVVNLIPTNSLKPFLLIVLIIIAVYTFFKKDLGDHPTKQLPFIKQAIYGGAFSILIGFYDGFFGPGTGSFLILVFVVVLGFDFLNASAYAKFINCITNIGALLVFISKGQFILPMAIIMAIFNMAGSYFGSSMALTKGNGFIRKIFLVIVTLMIARYGWEVFSNK